MEGITIVFMMMREYLISPLLAFDIHHVRVRYILHEVFHVEDLEQYVRSALGQLATGDWPHVVDCNCWHVISQWHCATTEASQTFQTA